VRTVKRPRLESEDEPEVLVEGDRDFWRALHRQDRESAREGQREVAAAISQLAASVEAMARMQDGDGTAVERIAAALEALVGRQATPAGPGTREATAGPSGGAGTKDAEPAAADDENEEEEEKEEKERGDVEMNEKEGGDDGRNSDGESEAD